MPTNTPTAKGEYGGNITQMVWQVRGREKQVYTLQYDFLNRMTEAHYSELNNAGGRTKDLDKYMEKLSYDARGNITHLTRNGQNASCGSSLIDNLTYSYNSSGTNINRLNSVTDAADLTKGFKVKPGQTGGGTYTYDANGNMITDPNKGITSIVYNHLNLPEKITFIDGNVIQWLYDASGTKLRKTTTQVSAVATLSLDGVPIANNIFTNGGLITSKGSILAGGNVTMAGGLGVELQPGFLADAGSTFIAYQSTTGTVNVQDYINGFEYHNSSLEAVYHAEGRIIPTTKNGILQYLYEYALKDHLGNTRVMFCDKDGSGTITQNSDQELNEVTQENHYYPFGMAMEGVWSNTPSISDNKYLYNGKELNDDFGLGWNDYGARMYDAAIGRFSAVDRFSKKYPQLTLYQYGANNPILNIDVNGDSINVAQAVQFDKDNKTDYMQQVIGDLNEQTGLTTYVSDDNKLEYKKDSDGNPIVAKDSNGKEVGSATERKLLIKGISNTKVASFSFAESGGSQGENLNFTIDVNQIKSFIKGTSAGLNPKTMGFGLNFIHEMNHTEIGLNVLHGDEISTWGKTGRVVNVDNLIRKELGESYGQRMSYLGFEYNGQSHLPFDSDSKSLIFQQLKVTMQKGNMYPKLSPISGKFISY